MIAKKCSNGWTNTSEAVWMKEIWINSSKVESLMFEHWGVTEHKWFHLVWQHLSTVCSKLQARSRGKTKGRCSLLLLLHGFQGHVALSKSQEGFSSLKEKATGLRWLPVSGINFYLEQAPSQRNDRIMYAAVTRLMNLSGTEEAGCIPSIPGCPLLVYVLLCVY